MAEHQAVAPPALVDEVLRIIEEGKRRGLVLRAFGGVGFYIHAENRAFFAELGRGPINDLDLVGLSEQRNEYKKLFKDLSYEIDWDLLVAGQGRRFLFQYAGEPPLEVDLFIDRLDMCHRIDLRGRIELQPFTLSLADLALQKLQIVDLNRKDNVDVIALLAEHELNGEGPETVDTSYVSALLADDWGFYYTVTRNLARIGEYLETAPLEGSTRQAVEEKLRQLQREIEDAPKTRRWKLRARIGPRKKWYQEVEEGTAAF